MLCSLVLVHRRKVGWHIQDSSVETKKNHVKPKHDILPFFVRTSIILKRRRKGTQTIEWITKTPFPIGSYALVTRCSTLHLHHLRHPQNLHHHHHFQNHHRSIITITVTMSFPIIASPVPCGTIPSSPSSISKCCHERPHLPSFCFRRM